MDTSLVELRLGLLVELDDELLDELEDHGALELDSLLPETLLGDRDDSLE